MRLQPLPNGRFVTSPALGDRHIDSLQCPLERSVQRLAAFAIAEMLLQSGLVLAFGVVVQNQFFFRWMIHRTLPTSGSRARRSFWTARNTLCLAAPGWQPST